MATSTYKTFLMMKESSTYGKLADIKDYPDLGGAPEMLETTTLSDSMQTHVPGIQSLDSLQFTLNYDEAVYDKLVALKDIEKDFAVWFGGTESAGVVTPTGDEGKFQFKGMLSVYVTGKHTNEVREMVVSIAATTVITKVA